MLPVFQLFALGVLAVPVVTAQKPAAPGPPSGNPASPAMTLPVQPSPGPQDQWPGSQLPVMLSGTVVVEGGGDVPSNVTIQRLCSGVTPRTVAWVNARGEFSFRWNDFSGVLPEASDPGSVNMGRRGIGSSPADTSGSRASAIELPGANMRGCELEANAPGFRSDRVELTEHRALDNPDLGRIVLHRLSRVEGLSVSASSLYAPKEAQKAWEKGVQLLRSEQQSDVEAAEKEFERAVRIYPRYAAAWLGLGQALKRGQAEDRARDAFLKAIEADNKLVEGYLQLGMTASHRRQWPEAAQYLDRALQLDPVHYPHLWLDDAEADYHVGNLDRAEKNVRQALKTDLPGRDPAAMRLLGLVLMGKQDYAGAQAALLTYLRESPDVEDWDDLRARLEEIHGKLSVKP